jgi:hypothetical protein
MPETMAVLFLIEAAGIHGPDQPFMTMPWPQPGHQMCGSLPGRIDFS